MAMLSTQKSKIYSFLLALVLLSQSDVFSQDTKTMELILKVRNEDVNGTEPIPGTSIVIYDKSSNKVIQSQTTPANGNAKFVLELYKDYSLTFTKKEFVTKKLLIDGNVPGKENKAKLNYYVEYVVNMYTLNSSKLGAELLDKPFDKLIYFSSDNQFDSDKDYQTSLKRDLAKLTPQAKANLITLLKGGSIPDDPNKDETKYKDAIARGDRALGTADYNKAKEAYNQALAIKPGDKYAQDKLKQVAVALKPRTPADVKYNDLITKADADFSAKSYELAKSSYLEASKVKPAEKYPKDKIAEIEQLVGKNSAKRYKDAIYKADKLFVDKNFAKAKDAYTEAAAISPNEKYPKEKLKEIANMYKDAIYMADKLFLNKEYDRAKEAYSTAIACNPTEQYPKDQIKEINKQLDKNFATGDYASLIANGDKAFKEKNYIKAKEAFVRALKQNPGEKYPKEQLVKIDALTAKDPNFRKDVEKRYNEAMKKGKEALDIKDLERAKGAYTEASILKPEQKTPKLQMAKVEELLKAAAKELDAKYEATIAIADKELGLKHYDKAKISYTDALTLKPNEKYPKEKLEEVDKQVLFAQNRISDKYKAALNRGDKAFKEKEYEKAKVAYTEAAAIDPNEKRPKDRLAEIDKLIKEMEKNLSDIDRLMDHNTVQSREMVNSTQISQQLLLMREEQQVKVNQMKMLKKAYAKHMANLSTKYSTQNPLTKLLDIVDSKDSTNIIARKK
jgi:tetratricopeptide (TPR) repeat protein